MTTAIERFKRRKAILEQAAANPTPRRRLTQAEKEKIRNEPVDMDFVNAPSAADEIFGKFK